ncbi:MAG: hypothetical protein ACXABY_17705 [Candidatus Thorarchaeota archaeon]|jgi:hypothetical protein
MLRKCEKDNKILISWADDKLWHEFVAEVDDWIMYIANSAVNGGNEGMVSFAHVCAGLEDSNDYYKGWRFTHAFPGDENMVCRACGCEIPSSLLFMRKLIR